MKRFVKLLVIVLAVAALGAIMTLASSAEEPAVVDSGECGENVSYVFDSEGTLTISGTGAMTDYTYPNGLPWADYRNNVKRVVIGRGVTGIGEYAFYGCDSLMDVTIPDSVTVIGSCAFYSCDALVSVTIPGSVERIGNDAFEFCSVLAHVTLGDGVVSIGSYAFRDCEALESLNIPASVTSIGNEAFNGNKSLTAISVAKANPAYTSQDGVLYNKAVTKLICCPAGKTGSLNIPYGVTDIAKYAFEVCGFLTDVTIPESMTSISQDAFCYCHSLTSVTIPTSVTSIGEYAFYSCYSLTGVTIPKSVTSIGNDAFGYCYSLTSVSIPASVASLGGYAFYECAALTDIYCEAPSQPDGWDATWNYKCGATVHWDDIGPVTPDEPEGLFGDLNGDGIVSIQDVTVLLMVIADQYNGPANVAAIPPKFEY